MDHQKTEELKSCFTMLEESFNKEQETSGLGASSAEGHPLMRESHNVKDRKCERLHPTNNTCQGKCCPTVNTTLLGYKSFYFFFLAATGSLIPFLPVFYKQIWLSAQQTGVLLGVSPLITVAAIPMWGVIIDLYKKSRFVFILSLVAWLVTYYSISLVPHVFHVGRCQDNSSVTLVENIISDLTNPEILPAKPLHALPQIRNKNRKSNNLTSRKSIMIKRSVLMDIESNAEDKTTKTKIKDYLRQLRLKLRKYDKTDSRLVSRILSIVEAKANSTADSNITEISKIFHQEQMERVFDFLNMQGHYPWPLDTVLDYKATRNSEEWQTSQRSHMFTVLFVIIATGTLLSSPAFTLADIATLQHLGEKQEDYGKQRLWGALGWGLGAFFVGSWISTTQEIANCNNPLNVDYMLCFYTFAVLMGITILLGGLFEFEDTKHEELSLLRELSHIIFDFRYIYFIVTIFFCGCATGVIQTFLFWHLEEIGGSQLLYSAIIAFQCLSEILMYYFSGTLIVFLGYHRILYIGLVCFAIRFFGYAFIANSWMVLPLELLHGITHAAVWSAGVVYVGLTPGASTTMQGILGGIYFGLGCGGGGIVGGVIVSFVGCPYTFLIMGIISLINLSLLVFVNNQCCIRSSSAEDKAG